MKKNPGSIFILALAAILSVFASCNKLSKATVTSATLPVTPDSISLKSRVIVIDSTQLILASTAAQLSQGVYTYTSNATIPGFMANDIIIGITGAGYLRKVTSVLTQQNQVVLNTVQAKLEDVFEQGNINFSTGLSTTSDSYQYNITNALLYQDASASATITSGSITTNPEWNFNMQFQNGTMTRFSAICQNGVLNAAMQLNVISTASDNINVSSILNSASGRTIIWIGQLPIVVTTNLAFPINITGSVSGSVNSTLSMTTNDTYTLGDVYASGSWQNQYNFTHNSTLNQAVTGATVLNVSCGIVSQMDVMIYGVDCPRSFISLYTSETGNIASFTQQPAFSVSGTILGYAVPDNSNSWNTDTISYAPAYKLIKVSGDGQTGTAYQYLPKPLMVQVVDNNGNAQANVPVNFSVTSGGGTLSNATVTTNSGGFAQTNWLIGNPASSSQVVQASITIAGTRISGSPVSFTAW